LSFHFLLLSIQNNEHILKYWLSCQLTTLNILRLVKQLRFILFYSNMKKLFHTHHCGSDFTIKFKNHSSILNQVIGIYCLIKTLFVYKSTIFVLFSQEILIECLLWYRQWRHSGKQKQAKSLTSKSSYCIWREDIKKISRLCCRFHICAQWRTLK
jgi:hypothetical protein